jgi:drug/metabolite transporter (DMT)-like permease
MVEAQSPWRLERCIPSVHFGTSGVFIGAVAHTLIGVSLVWDKVLLGRRETSNVVNYVFWLGFLSIIGVAVAAFGFHFPSLFEIGLALAAGILHMISVFFYYLALKRTEASRALAIMGGFAPVATALIAVPLIARPLEGESILGFALMTAGGFVMFFSDRVRLTAIIPLAIASAATGGLSNVVQKIVFNAAGFTSGYVFFVIGSSAGAALLLVRGAWRRQIFQQSRQISNSKRVHYLANRGLSGLGSILVYVAISRTSPAIVDALSGMRYVIIFAGTLILTHLRPDWLREQFTGRATAAKLAATALVVAGLALVGLNQGGAKRQPSRGGAAGAVVAGRLLLGRQEQFLP